MKLLSITVVLLFGFQVHAQTVDLASPSMSNSTDNAAFALVQKIVQALPKEERLLAQSVIIHISDEGIDRGPRTGILSGQRIVIVPYFYARLLEQMVDAQFLSLEHKSSTFPEEWLTYWGMRSGPGGVYAGKRPLSPLEYARLDSSEKLKFQNEFGEASSLAFIAAFTDILLHELGHHVANALYDVKKVSSSYARQQEAKADAWSTNAFKNFVASTPDADWEEGTNILGRFMSLVFLRELEAAGRLSGIQKPRTHPETGSRLKRAISASTTCTERGGDNLICSHIEATAKEMVSNMRTQATYRALVKSGDVFAHFKLAFMRGLSGDHAEACKLFEQVAKHGVELRAFKHVGECTAEGYLEKHLGPNARAKRAMDAYCIAARDGWLDAERARQTLSSQTGLPHSC